MSDSVDVSVIIPTYNEGEKVAQCVAALQAQKFSGSFEVIVVDNGSTKNLPEVPSDDARFRMIREPTPGSYAARNSGLRIARGRIIAFTDSDCLPDPLWLENAMRVFLENEAVSLIAGHIDVFPLHSHKPTSVELFEGRFAFRQMETVKQGWSVTANLIVRKRVIDEIGGFDVSGFSGGDSEFTKRAVSNGFQLSYQPNVTVRHPARRYIAELNQMRRRNVGGFYRLSKTNPEFADQFSFYGIAKDFVYPLKGAYVVISESLRGLINPIHAVKIIAVLTQTRFYRGFLKIKYRSGIVSSFERA